MSEASSKSSPSRAPRSTLLCVCLIEAALPPSSCVCARGTTGPTFLPDPNIFHHWMGQVVLPNAQPTRHGSSPPQTSPTHAPPPPFQHRDASHGKGGHHRPAGRAGSTRGAVSRCVALVCLCNPLPHTAVRATPCSRLPPPRRHLVALSMGSTKTAPSPFRTSSRQADACVVCSCDGSVVDCGGLQLVTIPPNIPDGTTTL